MTYTVYTLGIDTPGDEDRDPRSWQVFTNFITPHCGLVIVDLRFPRTRPPVSNPWNGLQLDRYFHAKRDHPYLILGHLLTELHGIESESENKFPGLHTTIAIGRLIAILQHSEDLLCFCEGKLYAGSVREHVIKLICERLPGIAHQELNDEVAGISE